jgi:hypothetical protein
MLSSSPAKICEPLVTGVSPRPTDQRGARKTAKHEGHHGTFWNPTRVAAPEHGDLVAEHEELDVLRGGRAPRQ